jgi:hypothetical protein
MTYKELIDNFNYNEITGKLIRTTRKNSNGSYDKCGYLIIKFNGKQYKAHRLIWFYKYKEMPKNIIDHINGLKSDNRIENLRDVDFLINSQNHNKKPNNVTGYIGIYKDEITKGLKSKYTTQYNNKTYRFENIQDCIKFRNQNNLKL